MSGYKTFEPRCEQDVHRLVLENPLAWVVSSGGATLLPVRPMVDSDGRIGTLVGHFARSNEQVALLRSDPRALILALGPHSYISPSWMQDRTQAPTWNYASVQFVVDIEFFEDEREIEAHLRDLVEAMEAQRPRAWNVDEMGQRYQTLARHIIGFCARVQTARAKFKLGQDERRDVFGDIMAGLARDGGAHTLLEWMSLFNADTAPRSERER